MEIDNYIGKLLIENQKVTIPNFGVFSSESLSASITKDSNAINPPSKRIVFNSKIQEPNETLSEIIAKEEKITVEEASKRIKDFVKTCKEAAIDGKVIVLNNVGKLWMNDEGDYVFEQNTEANFESQSFGLEKIELQPIKKMETKDILKKEMKKQEMEHKQKKTDKQQKKSMRPLIIWGSLALLIIAAAVFAYLNQDLTKKYYNKVYATISGSHEKEAPKTINVSLFQKYPYRVMNDTAITDAIYMFPFIDSSIVVRNFAYMGQPLYACIPYLSMHKPHLVIEEVIDENTQQTTPTQTSGFRFHIVAASFTQMINAEKYKNQLIQSGYANARVISNNYKGLHRVSYNSYETRNEAIREMNKIRNTVNSSAWVITQR